MRSGTLPTVGALMVALASVTACNRSTPPADDTSIRDEAARLTDQEAERQRERDNDIAKLNERVTKLDRDYTDTAAERPRGTSGSAARNLRDEIKEDVTHAREAVDDLRGTTVDNWWERHERALTRTAGDIEQDVRRIAGRAYTPAAPRDADPTPTADKGDTAPFTSRRDRFVTNLRARVDDMKHALGGVKNKGDRQTELEDTRARVDKLGDDLDRLKSASPDDWWDISKHRVSEYIDRVESSVARLDDVKGR